MTLTRLEELLRAWVIAQGYRIIKSKKWPKQLKKHHEAYPFDDEVAVGGKDDKGFCLFAVRNNEWNGEVNGQEVASYQIHITTERTRGLGAFVYVKDGEFVTIP